MSSHHFVREGQEPALFVLDPIPFSKVAPLLEWVPLVIVAEQALEVVLNWGIKIDVIVQQNLTVQDLTERLGHQFPLEIIAGQKDMLKIVMEYLMGMGHKFVNIISDASPIFLNDLEKFGVYVQIGIYTGDDKWSHVTTGRFEKWLPMKHCFYVLDDNKVSIAGAPTIQQGNWRETTQSGVIVIESPSSFWIVERLFESESSGEKNFFHS